MDRLEEFGRKVFNEKIMKETLPSPVFKKWKAATNKSDALDRTTADAIAHAMKQWALNLGATHYCHWFQPLTGSTAEKHDAFIDSDGGTAITKFSGKSLIKGEPDASSFPSGGLRATFEARGYTYWDCTSPAFVRDNVLCIPTVFVSFNGQPLDQKTPLLRSIDVVSKEATRIINAFGDKDVTSVIPCIGLEQEYFLVDEKEYKKRRDLVICNRTLVGAGPAKNQDLEDHYFGVIPERVSSFMKDVDDELWQLGIFAKTEHNEAAPCQFELAPIFSTIYTAIDQNLIIMDVLRNTAKKHGLVCLLHEKPFSDVNGSGKHNNWSLMTNDGQNLLDPGDKPHENVRFLVFMSAIIKAVDEHAELIRLSCSGPGNDYRLGGFEAPPAIVSMYLGSQVEYIFDHLENGKPEKYEQSALSNFGLSTLSYMPHDVSDRNRTSPVAFTGNKIEFRMLGSSMNASSINTTLNLAVGDVLKEIADELETLKYRQEIREKSLEMCSKIIKEHKRILFTGNGYSKQWVEEEAVKRNLPNIKTFVEAIEYFTSGKSVDLFERYNILTRDEMIARSNILYESYKNVTLIEAKTLTNMVRQDIIPALVKEINDSITPAYKSTYLEKKIEKLGGSIDQLAKLAERLYNRTTSLAKDNDKQDALYCLQNISPIMKDIRLIVDECEPLMSKANYPYPSYEELFNSLD